MERANLAVAEFLAESGREIHLVGHSFDSSIARQPSVSTYRVDRPFRSHLAGQGLLNRKGQSIARAVLRQSPAARVLVNGGNCDWDDVNWVHFVHHAWNGKSPDAPLWFRLKDKILGARARRDELRVIPKARTILSNSAVTSSDLVNLLGVAPGRVHTVYLGTEPGIDPPNTQRRADARSGFGIEPDQLLVVFVGALGYDTRKGFDTLLEAWAARVGAGNWNGVLLAAGGGRGLTRWEDRVKQAGLSDSVRLLGYTDRVAHLLDAADLLVSPVRYEAYGLNVQEALCRGVPAMVSCSAGIAERYPRELSDLLIDNPDDPSELSARLLDWSRDVAGWRERIRPLAALLRSREWKAMARDMVGRVEKQDSGFGMTSGIARQEPPWERR